jgi:hypothetical protein
LARHNAAATDVFFASLSICHRHPQGCLKGASGGWCAVARAVHIQVDKVNIIGQHPIVARSHTLHGQRRQDLVQTELLLITLQHVEASDQMRALPSPTLMAVVVPTRYAPVSSYQMPRASCTSSPRSLKKRPSL